MCHSMRLTTTAGASFLAGIALALAACSAMAQLVDLDPDWQESELPAPPAFSSDRLVPVDMPRHITLMVGVDPLTIRITADGLVRYVVVAKSSGGTINASYEAIRCMTGEVKTYARYSVTGKWVPVANPQWKPLGQNQPSQHAIALAQQGLCNGRSVGARSPAEIVRRLTNATFDTYQK
jgi:hypothetical protein